jgi:sugar lactone lactonase YvrE
MPIKMAVERLDPAMDELVPANIKVEKLAEGFLWSEGPAWFEGSVVFSDVPDNVIYRWKPNETFATVFMKPSGLLNPSSGFRQPAQTVLLSMRTAACSFANRESDAWREWRRAVCRLRLPPNSMASASTRRTT